MQAYNPPANTLLIAIDVLWYVLFYFVFCTLGVIFRLYLDKSFVEESKVA